MAGEITMVRVGDAPPGTTPFSKNDEGVICFDGQQGRRIDYGHAFFPDKGYRVFFRFADSPAYTTWGPADLLKWAKALNPATDEDQALIDICQTQAGQCITLNNYWALLGKPANGIPLQEGGRC